MRIHLHSELSSSHSSHGISHEDYAQYAGYCTRRLSRLRHGKPVKKELLHCRQYKNALSTKKEEDGGGAGGGVSKAKHAYRAIDMTNLPSEVLGMHVNYFWEPLYCAERCWAASMAVKAEYGNDSSNGGGGGGLLGSEPKKEWSPGKIRAHSIKRLRKAAKFATLLETLTACTKKAPSAQEGAEGAEKPNGEEETAAPPVDEHTQMEAKAYASWMRGNLALEQNQWQTACNEYQMALTLCESLASNSNVSSGGDDEAKDNGNAMQQLELLDFFTTRGQNVIAPLLRYCHYELQEKGMSPTEKISFLQSSSSVTDNNNNNTTHNDPLQSKLQSLKVQTLQSQATSGSSMSEIVFRENTIAVETKELRMALLKIQDLKGDWEEDKNGNTNNNNASDAKFMALLSGHDDAISLTNQELKLLATLKSGPAVNAKKFQLVNIVGYAKFKKLKLVMGRNEDLAKGIVRRNRKKGMTLKHFEEVAHLYDALLQDARVVASLPGGGSAEDYFEGGNTSSASAVEDEFLLEANATILRLRSLRCYYLAKMHASPLVHKYPEAVALLDQAESLAQEASEEIGACDEMEGGDEMLEHLESVLEEMRGEKCRVLAVSYLNKNTSSAASGKCLLERLYDYGIPSASAPLSHVPPKLEPMACKPSFFDVALNYVSDYPVDELEKALGEHGDGASSASTGFLGWFRR